MSPREIICIKTLLSDVHRGLCEGGEPITMNIRLDELYEVTKRLMDATSEVTDTEMKVKLAHMEYRERQYRKVIQDRLAIND